MKIVQIETIRTLPQSLLLKLPSYYTFTGVLEPMVSLERLGELAFDADILILRSSSIKRLDATALDAMPKLKHLALANVGTDYIDLTECKKRGISISLPIGANSEAVAEHAFGLMLSLSKRIAEFDRDIRYKGEWDFRKYTGRNMFGKTLGLIGFGNVGSRIARIAAGFEMPVQYYDEIEITSGLGRQTSLTEVVQTSDYIVVAVPLTESTKLMVNKELIDKMKKGVFLVNIARQGIVNETAVCQALESGKIAGFGLDSDILQPISSDNPLLKYSNVLINVHNAFNTQETQEAIENSVVENICAFIRGEENKVRTLPTTVPQKFQVL